MLQRFAGVTPQQARPLLSNVPYTLNPLAGTASPRLICALPFSTHSAPPNCALFEGIRHLTLPVRRSIRRHLISHDGRNLVTHNLDCNGGIRQKRWETFNYWVGAVFMLEKHMHRYRGSLSKQFCRFRV